jgi:hypothetical protein
MTKAGVPVTRKQAPSSACLGSAAWFVPRLRHRSDAARSSPASQTLALNRSTEMVELVVEVREQHSKMLVNHFGCAHPRFPRPVACSSAPAGRCRGRWPPEPTRQADRSCSIARPDPDLFPLYVPHARRQRALGGVEAQVVMVVQQVVGMVPPLRARDDVLQSLQEAGAVVGSAGEGEVGVPARDDRGEGAWECHARGSGHGGSLTALS